MPPWRRAEEAASMMHRLFVLLTMVAASAPGSAALAQGTLSTPSPEEQPACLKGFTPLREDAEWKGRMIKAASERHAPPEEACKIIGSYRMAEVKMIKYVEANAAQCGIQTSLVQQLKVGYKNTEALEKKACAVADQNQRGVPGQINDFGDPAFERYRF
jgi:hypothetical protein